MGSPDGSAVKNQLAMREMWVQSLGLEDPLQEESHYRIPAWNIPWTEEPGGLPPKGSRIVGHN